MNFLKHIKKAADDFKKYKEKQKVEEPDTDNKDDKIKIPFYNDISEHSFIIRKDNIKIDRNEIMIGYENIEAEDMLKNIADDLHLNPRFLSINFYDKKYTDKIDGLNYTILLTMIVPVSSEITNVSIIDKEGNRIILEGYFKYTGRLSKYLERQVAELHISSVKPANGNKNNHNTYLAYDILSLENNDELKIEYNVKLHTTVVDFIKKLSIKYINEKYSAK